MYRKFLFSAIMISLGLGISACSPRHETLCTGNTIKSCEPSIYFAFNSTEMNRNAPGNLDWVAAKMKRYPDRTVYVSGYADLDGEERYNKSLSFARAQVVKDELTARGVSSNRIKIRGMGQSDPRTMDLEEQKLNRRADVTFGHVPHEYALTCNDD